MNAGSREPVERHFTIQAGRAPGHRRGRNTMAVRAVFVGWAPPPARFEFEAWSNQDMQRCCINRHAGFVGCAFADASVRKVGLKELWTLKWSKQFNTAGYYTLAGGMTAEEWPDWIRPLKDF